MMRKGSSAETRSGFSHVTEGELRNGGSGVVKVSAGLTGQSLARVGAALQGFVAVHAQALEGAVGVDASLAAREGGGALVNVHASLSVILQVKARPAFTLIKETNRFFWGAYLRQAAAMDA